MVSNERLNGYDNGFGSNSSPIWSDLVLSGQTWFNRSDFALLHGARPRICWAMASADWAAQAARVGRLAGPS
jgi:hypothetical protein